MCCGGSTGGGDDGGGTGLGRGYNAQANMVAVLGRTAEAVVKAFVVEPPHALVQS